MSTLNVQSTPNPNSIKISQEGVQFGTEMHSFDSPEQAANHSLGGALFHVDGVDNVFIVSDFITVTKTPDASWDDLLPALKRIVSDHIV